MHTAEVSPAGSPSLGNKPLYQMVGGQMWMAWWTCTSVQKRSPTETEMLSCSQAIHLTNGGHTGVATIVEVHLQVLNSSTFIETDMIQKSPTWATCDQATFLMEDGSPW